MPKVSILISFCSINALAVSLCIFSDFDKQQMSRKYIILKLSVRVQHT